MYYFFWSGAMSNFQVSKNGIPYLDQNWRTSEQIYMYMKAKFFKDFESMRLLENKNLSPKEAKAIGRKVKNFNNDLWDEVKYDIMKDILLAKFSQDEFALVLKSTIGKTLVEASPFDRIWGIGFNSEDAQANIQYWGENLLGKCLMEVREELFPSIF